MCLGTAALASALSRDRGRAVRTAAAAAVFALGVHGLWLTVRLEVFHRDEGDRRYVTVAEIVGGRTEPSAVILTGQHVGSVNYYTGRQTLQFERFDPAWLDRAFVWLEAQGRHPYILLEDWERPLFEQRFAGSTLGRLAMAPVAAYKGRTSGTIYLFDPRRPDGPTDLVAPERHPVRCVAPRGGG
jgi:hypothetical protein